MCVTKFSKHPKCGHWSCEIKEPCQEGRDFFNCPSFNNGRARNPAKHSQETAKENTCPKCDKNNEYDGKKIRMIGKTVHATKIGFGPSVSHLLQTIPFCAFCEPSCGTCRKNERLLGSVHHLRCAAQRNVLTRKHIEVGLWNQSGEKIEDLSAKEEREYHAAYRGRLWLRCDVTLGRRLTTGAIGLSMGGYLCVGECTVS